MNWWRFHYEIKWNKKSVLNISSPYFMLTYNGNESLRQNRTIQLCNSNYFLLIAYNAFCREQNPSEWSWNTLPSFWRKKKLQKVIAIHVSFLRWFLRQKKCWVSYVKACNLPHFCVFNSLRLEPKTEKEITMVRKKYVVSFCFSTSFRNLGHWDEVASSGTILVKPGDWNYRTYCPVFQDVKSIRQWYLVSW